MGGGAWGPPCLSPHVQRRIDGLRAWAAVPGDGHPEWPEWARGDQRYNGRIGDLLARWAAGDLSKRELARSGGGIYAALWRAGLGGGGGSQETVAAMIARAKARRWFPASGDEWGFARYVTGFNTVLHVSKILCGGTSPGVALRSREDIRARLPRRCDACGSRHVAWSWITGGPGHPGMAWCEECLDGIGHLSPWAWVLGDAYAGDGDLGEAVRATPAAPPCMAEGAWRAMTTFYGACPLCSRGEHVSEHLAIWCPAVAAAWLRVGASHGPSLVRALSGDRDAAACAARLLRQASFIASSIHNKSAVEWREGADWLARAVCTPDSSEDGKDGGGDTDGPPREGDPAYAYVWEETGGCGCWECEDRAGADRPTSARPGAPDRDGGPPMTPGHAVAAATGAIDEGQVVVTLRSRGVPATWVAPGEHWWPPPVLCTRGRLTSGGRFAPAGNAGKRGCLSSLLRRPIQQGGELRAETGYPGQVYLPDEAALHFAMDGSAKGQTAGAGAVLWARGELGRWRRIAEAAISIGSKTSPTCAEAWGLSAAADLLLAYGGSGRRVHISGDCLMVVRFCAEQGRMREYLAQRVRRRACSCEACRRRMVVRLDCRPQEAQYCAADTVARRARCRAIARSGFFSCPHERRARVSWFTHDFAAPLAQP